MKNMAMSLKAKIRNLAVEKRIPAQVILQNYMFERFLIRLSNSRYKNKFVIKGGMLIASIVGISKRATMDLDAMLNDLPLTESAVVQALQEICAIDLFDGAHFIYQRIVPIREDDIYGGYRVLIQSNYDNIIVPLSVDITTGDAITPTAKKHLFQCMFDSTIVFEVWAYNIETILGEKIETILRRAEFNTRPRDFYDVYILLMTQPYDKKLFKLALQETASHRGSIEQIHDTNKLLTKIESSPDLLKMWNKYSRQFSYANNITYGMIISEIRKLLSEP